MQGIGISDGDANERPEDVYDRYKRQYGDDNTPPQPSSSGSERGGGQRAGAGGKGAGAGRNGEPGGRARSDAPPPKSFKQAVDDDLEELKRKMGLK